MRSAEARNMQPDSSSGPESERKPRLIEGMVEETPESKSENAGDRFAADADAFNSLQERATNKALEMAKLEEGPLAANQDAKNALQKEMDSIQASIDKVADKYGDKTEDFVADAIAKRDLDARIADKRKQLEALSKTESLNIRGGERMKQIQKETLMAQLADLHSAQADLLGNYDAAEASAKADFAAITPEDISLLVDQFDQPIEVGKKDIVDSKESEKNAEAIKDVKSFDDLEIVLDHVKLLGGSDNKGYTADELKTQIDHARKFPVLLGTITRTAGLRDKVAELIRAERANEELAKEHALEQKFFETGEKMSEAHAKGEEYEEWIEVTDDMIMEEAPSKEEVQAVVEKNELSPERRKVVEAEIQKLKNEIFDLERGMEYVDRDDSGKIVDVKYRPGLQELEGKLKEQYGLSADDLMEKKALSRWEGLKIGLKGLFSPDFKKTVKMYEERAAEWSDAKQRLAESEMELRDPQGYAEAMQRRLMKTLMLRAKQAASAPRASGSPFNMRF
ncbi:MAG TPA: hypothetical protein VLC10_03865 [Patescibacteria group bacterium]|nr:hypothetical protein [Patescibacteria group bacterium]